MKIMEKYYSLREVALQLDFSKRTIWNWVQDGQLRAVKLPNGQLRISRAELNKFMRKAKNAKTS